MATKLFIFFAIIMANYPAFCQAIISPVNQNLITYAYALLEFKSQITSDPYKRLANWSLTYSVCKWPGVYCRFNGRVMSFNVSNARLEGTISPYLGNLTSLISIDIRNNFFSGSVPNELANLQSLRQMLFGFNSFSGEIPSWIGVLQELKTISLENNRFTGAIPAALFNVSKLQRLYLGYNFLGGSIPQGIANLSSLLVLNLRDNWFSGSIPFGILNMTLLQEIDLTNNSLSGNIPMDLCSNNQPKMTGIYLSYNHIEGAIPSELHKCRDLEELALDNNQFNGNVPRTLGYLSKLKLLYIGGNIFSGGIPSEIGNLTMLEQFSMSNSSLTGQIPSFIFNMSSLQLIDLSKNSLSGSFPVNMWYNLPVLRKLELSTNQLSGPIPSFVWDCQSLIYLYLNGNNFTGGMAKRVGNLTSVSRLDLSQNHLQGELVGELVNCINLKMLSVEDNNLSGLIEPRIFNMSSLEYFGLSLNRFSGSLPSGVFTGLPNIQEINLLGNRFSGTFPNFVVNSSKLALLALSVNYFTGPIPSTLGNLRSLKYLFLHDNNFTRESSTPELRFISSLTNCRELESVEISHNQFDGFLPTSFGNFSTSLRMFRAFGSRINGTIPSEIGNLSSLQAIYLDNNDLTGTIPSSFGKLSRVEQIYLEHNRLQGHIPTELCQMKILGDLYLNDNMFYGPIPDCLGEIKTLRGLFLHSNNLSSTIPLSLWGLKDLLGLNLSSNALSGHLPPEIQNLKVITQLDLSWNQLSGKIPSSLGSAQALVILSMAHNKFQGHIPASFGNLVSIETLDLSQNEFTGTMPKSLGKLGYMKHFNVSSNKLGGEIPEGGPFSNLTDESFMNNYALCSSGRLRFPSCKRKDVSKSWSARFTSLAKYILPPILLVLLLVAAITIQCRKRSVPRVEIQPEPEVDIYQGWRKVSYQEILEATDSLSGKNFLGIGSFGSVYKGVLSDGSTIAIKVFQLQTEGSKKSFHDECQVLASIRHRNLIRIISCYSSHDFKALVLDYMPNGSLENWLYSNKCFLDMLQRLDIMIDVASGLEYLHHDQKPPIVHCDLKPSNILLDEDMAAHVSDFGTAKLFGEGEIAVQTKTVATIGYMAPEYGMQGIVSTKCDVYSYGVLLLETFTRRKPTDHFFGEELNLKHWISKSIQAKTIISVADNNLITQEDQQFGAKEERLFSIFHLGLNCLADSSQERPNMRDVVKRLRTIKVELLKHLQAKEILSSAGCKS